MSERWRRVKTTVVADCAPWLRVLADRVALPDGRELEPYYRTESRDYCEVFAVTDDDRVVLIRQYKYAADATGVFLPAGYLEEGEPPMDSAKRELLEETGYEAAEWQSLGTYYADANRGYGRAHFFLATGAREVQAPMSGDLEEISVMLTPMSTLLETMASDEVFEQPPLACAMLALTRLGRLRITD